MRKKNNSEYKPMSLKVLSRFGYLGHLAFIGVVIFLLVNDLKRNAYLNDFLLFSRTSLETIGEIIEINYFSRAKHLAYYYPDQLK